jgi:hypothetical protein
LLTKLTLNTFAGCLLQLTLMLALDLIVASHLLGLTKAARDNPEQAASTWLERDQWEALYCYIQKTHEPPSEVPSLKVAVDWIARLGGYLNRKCDGPPGAQVLWRGMRRLEDIAEAYRIFRNPGNCG